MLIVLAVMFLAVFWFSTRVGEPGEPSTVTSDIRLEVAWTAIPALILVFITVPTIRTIWATQPDHWPPDALTVKVIAHQWWWEFQYPQYGIDTADEVHLQAGRTVHFSCNRRTSFTASGSPRWAASVTWCLARSIRSLTRPTSSACITANAWSSAASRTPTCVSALSSRARTTSTSGSSNSSRHRPLRRAARPRRARRFSPTRPARSATRSRVCRAFRRSIRATSGPDLTHFGTRTTLAGGILENTPENLATWIQDPDTVKPGANMPKLGAARQGP